MAPLEALLIHPVRVSLQVGVLAGGSSCRWNFVCSKNMSKAVRARSVELDLVLGPSEQNKPIRPSLVASFKENSEGHRQISCLLLI